MSTSLPALPELPSLTSRPQVHPTLANAFSFGAPSGNGWGFTPDSGWESGFSINDIFGGGGGGDIFGGGGGGFFGSGPSSVDPTQGGGFGIGSPVISIGGGGGGGGTATTIKAGTGTSSSVGFLGLPGLPSIDWGRIGAFLLGLLLIAGGLFLIKPVQQAVKITVKHGSELLAD
jgi:hypothetical protein